MIYHVFQESGLRADNHVMKGNYFTCISGIMQSHRTNHLLPVTTIYTMFTTVFMGMSTAVFSLCWCISQEGFSSPHSSQICGMIHQTLSFEDESLGCRFKSFELFVDSHVKDIFMPPKLQQVYFNMMACVEVHD